MESWRATKGHMDTGLGEDMRVSVFVSIERMTLGMDLEAHPRGRDGMGWKDST